MDFIQTYAWVFWLALIMIFIIIEVVTVDFTFLMIAIGSVGGLISGLFNVTWGFQIVIAGVLALLLLFTVRPPLLRILKRGGDHAKSNVDALMGLAGVVIADFNGKASNVKLANGETWTAKLAGSPETPLHEGDHVVVASIDGSTAYVVPAERNTHE
jgi:membrane protein implicated in regulation of membrane protease activity